MEAFKVSILFLSLLLVHGANGQCSDTLTTEELNDILTSLVTNTLNEGGGTVEVNTTAWNVNCLVVAPTGGYQMLTVTVVYDVGGTAIAVPLVNEVNQLFLRCDTQAPLTAQWVRTPAVGLISISPAMAEELLAAETNRSCLSCDPFRAPNSPTFCSPCSDDCSQGLMQCYLDDEDQEVCCSFYDFFGDCVTECGVNQIPSEDFQCTCTGFFGPPGVCDVCGLECQNGVADGNCNFCFCEPGYAGRVCDEDIDECSPNPCERGGTCEDGIDSFTCTCPRGYTGERCEIDIDECESNPCQRGGDCIDGVDSFICTCPQGFSGIMCEVDVNECEFNTCERGGTCVDGINTFTCVCPEGFTGQRCEIDIDDCVPNPCENDGICKDGVATYTCDCPPEYTGINCDISTDDCLSAPCGIGGICEDRIDGFTCICLTGFAGDLCEIDLDDCFPNFCLKGATCVDGINSFECLCAPGFTGEFCDRDIDDCASSPCLNGGTCMDQTLGFVCDCPISRSGPRCEFCADGFTLTSGVCVRDCAPFCTFMEADDAFSQDLCKFYCQLEFWRELAAASGITLPEVNSRDLSLSPEEQWNQAIAERDRFGSLWQSVAMSSGVNFTSADTPSEPVDSTNFDRWKQLLERSLDEQTSWQDLIAQNQPEIDLQSFDTIEEICQAIDVDGVSPVYGSLLSTWALQSAQCT